LLSDEGLYPVDVFKELYHLRWTIEESYKTAKCCVELENFSGKTVESVYQDFFAKVFTLNLTAALTHPAQDAIDLEAHQKKHPYRINFTQALDFRPVERVFEKIALGYGRVLPRKKLLRPAAGGSSCPAVEVHVGTHHFSFLPRVACCCGPFCPILTPCTPNVILAPA
jgi:hypothetical protein